MIEPRANPNLCGHDAAVSAFYHGATSARLHHGWLISGASGIGKATLAFRFARWLLAGATSADLSLDPAHPIFRRVSAGTHPDLFTVERRINEKTERLQSEIVINTVREACQFMRLTPAEGGWRVVVIDGAEDMNSNAANALLKILEEPPKQAILLLLVQAPSRLLPTIRSRCRALPLANLPDATMLDLLNDYAPNLTNKTKANLVDIAEGSIGNALALAADDGIVLAGLVDEALTAPVSPERAQSIADTVARSIEGVDKFAPFMTLLRNRLAARTRHAARVGVPPATLAAPVTLWQEFGALEREVIGLNLDKRAAIITALSQLHGP